MQYLNEYHRQQHELSKQMEKERSARPPRSQREWLDQVNRLTKAALAGSGKSARARR